MVMVMTTLPHGVGVVNTLFLYICLLFCLILMVLMMMRTTVLQYDDVGVTKPMESAPGTIRGDFGIDVGRNIIHGSDSVESAQREIALWFNDNELVAWEPVATKVCYDMI